MITGASTLRSTQRGNYELSEPMPVRMVNAHCLADFSRHDRNLLLCEAEHIDLDVKQIVGGKFGANAPRDNV
jgi:hypothetical protein